MDVWDGIIWAAAAFVAVTVLVRLMLARRNQRLSEIQRLIAAEKQRQRNSGAVERPAKDAA